MFENALAGLRNISAFIFLEIFFVTVQFHFYLIAAKKNRQAGLQALINRDRFLQIVYEHMDTVAGTASLSHHILERSNSPRHDAKQKQLTWNLPDYSEV